MQTVIVNVDTEGNVKVEANGVQGVGCKALTREIEAAIGTTTADVATPEMYQQQKAVAGAAAGDQRR